MLTSCKKYFYQDRLSQISSQSKFRPNRSEVSICFEDSLPLTSCDVRMFVVTIVSPFITTSLLDVVMNVGMIVMINTLMS
jgi:hypothetical protein